MTPFGRALILDFAPQFPARLTTMLTQTHSSYRSYYYYGSLSGRRDEAAKDCRRVLCM
ncbi:MAG TPA: hypothetical protein VF634_05930 [Pyrinomonadaceae bacterium]